jgi:Zn-dependent protease with chaperone function
MVNIQGFWYDGQQSTQQPAVLRQSRDHYIDVVRSESDQCTLLCRTSGDLLTFSHRLGDSSRYIYFPDGQKFETRDNDRVDVLMSQFISPMGGGWLYYLETRWAFVVFSTVLMVCLGIWVLTDGVPVTAKYLAQVMPEALTEKAGEQTLALMDKQWMTESTLSDAEQQRVLQHFDTIMEEYANHNVRVLFRNGGDLGANAFALPDGTIIFTDKMVELSQDDNELLVIMAHEVGHVLHNHGMRHVIQGSMISLLVAMVAGDVSAASDMFLALPVLLTQLGYSRDFEREADDFALTYMLEKQLDPEHFVAIMTRLEKHYCEQSSESGNVENLEKTHIENCHDHSELQRYFSTHPATQDRMEKFRTH